MMRPAILTGELKAQLERELQEGERVIWADQPVPGLVGRQGLVLMLVGIPFTLFAIFWMAMTGIIGGHFSGIFSCFSLFGVPFVLVGVGMISSPLWIRNGARRTVYAVTDRRAIIILGKIWGGVQVLSFLPERLTSMIRNERADGSGDLIFEQYQRLVGQGTSTATSTVRRGFMGVRDVRDVENLIIAELLSNRTRSA